MNKYQVNPDSTLVTNKDQPKSDFAKRLEEKYPTPQGDKELDNMSNEFDMHKYYN